MSLVIAAMRLSVEEKKRFFREISGSSVVERGCFG
jgi:hypothetical protein